VRIQNEPSTNNLRIRYAAETDARNDTATTAAAVAKSAVLPVRRHDHPQRDVLRVRNVRNDQRVFLKLIDS